MSCHDGICNYRAISQRQKHYFWCSSMLLFSATSHLFDTHNTHHEHNNAIATVCSIHHEFKNFVGIRSASWISLHCCM